MGLASAANGFFVLQQGMATARAISGVQKARKVANNIHGVKEKRGLLPY